MEKKWLDMLRRTARLVGCFVAMAAIALVTTAETQSDLAPEPGIPHASANVSGEVVVPLKQVASLATSTALPDVHLVAFWSSPTPLYSLNGGVTWEPVPTTPWGDSTMAPLRVAIARRTYPGSPVRLLVAASSSDQAQVGIYRTGDGGQTWAKRSFSGGCSEPDQFSGFVSSPADPARLYIRKFCFECIPMGCTAYSDVYTSGNSGLSWEWVSPDLYEFCWSNPIPSPLIGSRVYVGCGDGWYQSEDSGQTWIPKSFPVDKLALDAQYADHLYGLVIYGGGGQKSTDGGSTWSEWLEQPCQYDDVEQLLAHPTLGNVLFTRCSSGIYRSTDGGDHWAKLSSWRGRWIGADFGNPGRILWARDDGLWASDHQGTTWVKLSAAYQPNPLAPWTNASTPDPLGIQMNAIASPAQGDVWAVGPTGTILHWQEQEWITVTSPISSSLNSLAFSSPIDGWAVGSRSILHWDGDSWSVVTDTIGLDLASVDVISHTNAWAVGRDGKTLHWDGDGWDVVTTTTTLPLRAVDMVSPDEGWAVGGILINEWLHQHEGVILRWNGSDWTTYTTTDWIPASVDMLSLSDGWIVGGWPESADSSRMLHWDGAAWQEVSHPSTVMLRSISMSSADVGWAVGGGYADYGHSDHRYPDQYSAGALRWDGDTWTEVELPTDDPLFSVTALFSGEAWVTTFAYGSIHGGSILRYRPVHRTYLPLVQTGQD